MEAYVGMDVHCKESVYVIQDATGRVIGEGSETKEGKSRGSRSRGLTALVHRRLLDVGSSASEVRSARSGFKDVLDPGVEALSTEQCAGGDGLVECGINPQDESARIGFLGRFALGAAEIEVVIDGVAECLAQFGDRPTLERDDVPQIEHFAVKDAGVVVELDLRRVAFVLHHSFTPASVMLRRCDGLVRLLLEGVKDVDGLREPHGVDGAEGVAVEVIDHLALVGYWRVPMPRLRSEFRNLPDKARPLTGLNGEFPTDLLHFNDQADLLLWGQRCSLLSIGFRPHGPCWVKTRHRVPS